MLFYTVEGSFIIVTGKTYGVKEELKKHGGRFRSSDKAWVLPNNIVTLNEVRKLADEREEIKSSTVLTSKVSSPKNILEPSKVNTSKEAHTIKELMEKIDSVITQNFSHSIWVVGEIQNLNQKGSGVFFQISEPKNERATNSLAVNAILWQKRYEFLKSQFETKRLNALLSDGMQVRFQCQVNFYKDRGLVSLIILNIDPEYTEGVLALHREKVIKSLQKKNFFYKNKKLSKPTFPLKIGLISAEDSRAKNDFLHQLLIYGFPGEVHFIPSIMQGEKTVDYNKKAISILVKEVPDLDFIVITRGGGSASDLRWFDDEILAEKVCLCPVPIISAIGHQDDITVLEDVSFKREKTPTAAADFILDQVGQLKNQLNQYTVSISRNFQKKCNREEERHNSLLEFINYKSQSRINLWKEDLRRSYSEITNRSMRNLGEWQFMESKIFSNLSKECTKAITLIFTKLQNYTTIIKSSSYQVLYRHSNKNQHLQSEIKLSSISVIMNCKESLFNLHSSLNGYNPESWIKKGWVRLFSKEGIALKAAYEAKLGGEYKVKYRDGQLSLSVKEKKIPPPETKR